MPLANVGITDVENRIISVKELLADSTLAIPTYQRPYKWTTKHINQLFSDIAFHKDKSSYRLGTIVFHREEDTNYIVDGQQRTISLLLAVRALIELRRDDLERTDLIELLDELEEAVKDLDPPFKNAISQFNIRNNYLEITRIVGRSDFTEELIDFLLNKCKVVIFILDDISEAFQFFDSQNARGRDLEPHDLLKAYHLREFAEEDAHLKGNTVARWEDSETDELASLFAKHLFRIRNWSRGYSARYFDKDEVGLFKGINIYTVARYPYVEQLCIAHHFIDHYNQQYERKIDGSERMFPFHLDQIIINGRRFFEMISHYQEMVAKMSRSSTVRLCNWLGIKKSDILAWKIIRTINTYPGRHRTGDQYVRTIFDCLLLYYLDKFGRVEISHAVEKIFIFAYSLRLNMQAVQLASMDNYVLEQNNLFKLIREATVPNEFISVNLPTLTEIRFHNSTEIADCFREMRYL